MVMVPVAGGGSSLRVKVPVTGWWILSQGDGFYCRVVDPLSG